MTFLNKRLNAFNLMEMSITLFIIGTTLTGILTLIKVIKFNQTEYINQKKYEYIKKALQNYVIQHGHLPYAANNNDGVSSNGLTNGFLPYKEIGINKSYSYDAKKQSFHYQVNKYLAKTNISIIMPLKYPPKNGETSFNRVYNIQNNEIIEYDIIANTPDDINIFENEINVISEKDYFYILPPITKFHSISELYKWYNSINDSKNNKFKCKNTIAWTISINGQYKYYQTRFDLSSQIGFYASPEPIYLDN